MPYDETIDVRVKRDGEEQTVMFCDVQMGDILVDKGCVVVDDDAHYSGDASYDGWLFYDTSYNSYFPEDFADDD